ncbi:MAG TPA: tripartite tricarboxylate transporter substrate binding protein [Burkholderiales bacterium]|nr:tripartite tricarboxylate transporter substrate binding protein [Burkholderiales bacterium]
MLNPIRVLRSLALALLLPAAALAQDYPSRTVTLVVPFPPSGGADILGRVLAKHLTEVWGQSVVVENKPGAAGTIGANAVGAAAPDGHTLVIAASGAVTPANAKALAPVSLLSAPPYLVVVNAAFPGANLKDFIAYAKANPGKVFFASSGAGSASHLSGELFMGLTDTKLTHVPYKGMGQAVQDLIGGQVTVMFGPPPVLLPHVRGGKLKALAVAAGERSPLFQEIPTAAEAGVQGFDAGAWYGILAPAGTPAAVINKISEETARGLQKPEVVKALASIGATPVGSKPAEFARYLDADIAKWDALLKKAGVTPGS